MRAFRTPLLLGLAAVVMVLSQVPANAKEERTTSNLNLRTGPGTHFAVAAVIPAGALVDIVSCGTDWCHLIWGGKPGYADARWLVSHVTIAVPVKPR
jgi:uncharacterized protein YraI